MQNTCRQCDQPFTSRQRQPYCSKTCANRAHAKSAEQNPNYKPKIEKTCETCSKAYSVKPSIKDRSRFCSVSCRIAYTRTLTADKRYNFKSEPKLMACEVCGKEVLVRHSMQGRFRACSKRCASEIGRRMWPRTSSLEVLMHDAFAAAGIDAIPQYPIDYYTVDFAVPAARLVIECDGVYWHGRPEQQAKDRRKDGYLRHVGWRVLRLSEDDIKLSPEACAHRVLAALNQG